LIHGRCCVSWPMPWPIANTVYSLTDHPFVVWKHDWPTIFSPCPRPAHTTCWSSKLSLPSVSVAILAHPVAEVDRQGVVELPYQTEHDWNWLNFQSGSGPGDAWTSQNRLQPVRTWP
jgi:hypothetical protein